MASLTITIPDNQVQRVQDAFAYHLQRPATVQDIREYIVNDLRQVVRSFERNQAIDTIAITDVDVT